MGIKLIVEILDHWRDAGLTAGERDDLIVLAENANDGTRLTWGAVHEPYILKRAGKSAASWKNSIGKLMKRGVLVQHVAGRIGQVAVYRVAELCSDAPHDGRQGFCTRPERVTSQVTLSKGEGHSTGGVDDEEGHLRDGKRVTSQVTPTPLYPSSTNPPPSPTPPSPPDPPAPDGREGGGIAALDEQHRPAYDALIRITTNEPRLTIGEQEALALLPLVVPWLERTTTEALREALTAGLPVKVGSAVGLLRTRLAAKLPPQRASPQPAGSLPPWCGECADDGLNTAARDNIRLRTLGTGGSGELCPRCHPHARAA